MTETIVAHEKDVTKELPVIQRLENGYAILQDATLTDGGTFLRNNDFCLVNPSGRILIHANDWESLETYARDPVILDRIERTGSVSE